MKIKLFLTEKIFPFCLFKKLKFPEPKKRPYNNTGIYYVKIYLNRIYKYYTYITMSCKSFK